MTDIERALVFYDGDDTMPHCDTVYRALKEMQRRQKGCVYCTGNAPLNYTFGDTDILISHCADLWSITADTWEFEIEYCPICGRKLRD